VALAGELDSRILELDPVRTQSYGSQGGEPQPFELVGPDPDLACAACPEGEPSDRALFAPAYLPHSSLALEMSAYPKGAAGRMPRAVPQAPLVARDRRAESAGDR